MKIAFDIGGVLSAYPDEFRAMALTLGLQHALYVITDMHPHEKSIRVLTENHLIPPFNPARVLSADYERYGNAAKAVILRDLGIDVLIDDFAGYLVWPWETPAPIRLHVCPDPRRPYWHDTWKCDGGEFGRRRYLDHHLVSEIVAALNPLSEAGARKAFVAEVTAHMRPEPLDTIDDRTPEQLRADGDDRWPDGTPYVPPPA